MSAVTALRRKDLLGIADLNADEIALILGFSLSGQLMRLTRAQMLEVMRQDYMRTARAKGATAWGVHARHVLRNALPPLVVLVALCGYLVVSAVRRLQDPSELEELGLEDQLLDGALLVEWPERAGEAAWPQALRLTLQPLPDNRRALTWEVPGAWEGRWPPR